MADAFFAVEGECENIERTHDEFPSSTTAVGCQDIILVLYIIRSYRGQRSVLKKARKLNSGSFGDRLVPHARYYSEYYFGRLWTDAANTAAVWCSDTRICIIYVGGSSCAKMERALISRQERARGRHTGEGFSVFGGSVPRIVDTKTAGKESKSKGCRVSVFLRLPYNNTEQYIHSHIHA